MVRVLPSGVPFLPKDCASPPASSVKALRFAPMNANYAALTAHAAKRAGRLGRALFFVQQSAAAQKAKTRKAKGANNATRTCRVVFPARQFRQGVPPTVGGRARPMGRSSAMGAARFRLAERSEGEWHQLRGGEASL